MQLHEEHRPQNWSDVVGQDKVIAKVEALRKRRLGRSRVLDKRSEWHGQDDHRAPVGGRGRGRNQHRGDRCWGPVGRSSPRD